MAVTGIESLLTQPVFGLKQAEKAAALLPVLRDLTRHHCDASAAYARVVKMTAPGYETATSLASLPYMPASLLKYRQLRSVPPDAVRTRVESSGTSGQTPSRIDLDADTAKLSSRALSATLGAVLGMQRLPLLIIDHESAVTAGATVKARAAAILGLMPYGRDVCFALKADYSIDHEKIAAFMARHQDAAIMAFGFTFMVWQFFEPLCASKRYDFSRMVLLHSGGWKKLAERAVDATIFNARFTQCGVGRVINFYGMAEAPGMICVENTDGLLYPPSFADIIIRDMESFAPLPHGVAGLIQIVNALPRSYPGQALLTADVGVIEAVDAGVNGYYGHGFRVLGRAPQAEMRGCSDVIEAAANGYAA